MLAVFFHVEKRLLACFFVLRRYQEEGIEGVGCPRLNLHRAAHDHFWPDRKLKKWQRHCRGRQLRCQMLPPPSTHSGERTADKVLCLSILTAEAIEVSDGREATIKFLPLKTHATRAN